MVTRCKATAVINILFGYTIEFGIIDNNNKAHFALGRQRIAFYHLNS